MNAVLAPLKRWPNEWTRCKQALRLGKPTVVEFGANACASCREMKPVLEALQREHGERIAVLNIDILNTRGYISRYKIQLMPTQVFFDAQGREIGRNMGKVSAGEILARLGVSSPEHIAMTGLESLVAALVGGIVTSAAPCVLAAVPVAVGYVGGQATTPRRAWALSLAFVAGMNVALLALGLLAARLGLLLGALPGPWSIAVGVAVAGAAVWLWRTGPASCGLHLPAAVERRLAQSGMGGAAVLGALIGTVMSPCATPALAAAVALAGSGALFGMSMLWGAALLLAYGLGHSVLLLLAGAMPSAASALARRFAPFQAWIPGRRTFALVMFATGLWWIVQGLDLY